MKQFTNFRLFRKVVRKYWKRYATKRVSYSKYLGRKYTFWMTTAIWCYYILQDINEFSDTQKRERLLYDMEPDDVPTFISMHSGMIGHNVNVINYLQENIASGCFIGFALANNGCYYIIDEQGCRSLYPLSVKLEKLN